IVQGSLERLSPILMTALVTAVGLIPLALGVGQPGKEIQQPMAVVILGGIVTSTFLNMIVIPPLYLKYGRGTVPVRETSEYPGEETAMHRREVLFGMFGTTVLGAVSSQLNAQAPPAAGGWSIKPLPFDPKKLKGLSEKLIVSHHDNNYAGAARRIGQIQQMLAGLPNNAPGFQIKGLKMEELIATNSAILHEEYFDN